MVQTVPKKVEKLRGFPVNQHFIQTRIEIVRQFAIKSTISKSCENIYFKIPSSIEKAIIKTNPDLVIILTPSGLHAKNALIALKYKKHVIIEKPMCLKISDAKKQRLLDSATK